jgi:hypothetical protein
MTPQEAYKILDLAKGLSINRVEAQFLKIKSEMQVKIASTQNERLLDVYNSRLDKIEDAYSSLIEHFKERNEELNKENKIITEHHALNHSKLPNPKWLWPATIAFVCIVALVSLLLLFHSNYNSQKLEDINEASDSLNFDKQYIDNQATGDINDNLETSNNENQYIESEDKESRIGKIKEWYANIQSMINLKQCEVVQRIKYEKDRIDELEIEMAFNQEVRICMVSNEFEVLIGSFTSYEWNYKISIYKRLDKVFFVSIHGGASEGYSYEKRFYADKNEKLIKSLFKEAYNGERLSGPNKEMEIKNNEFIKDKISSQFEDINWVLKAR